MPCYALLVLKSEWKSPRVNQYAEVQNNFGSVGEIILLNASTLTSIGISPLEHKIHIVFNLIVLLIRI
jgi:hypothetical protein